MKLKSLSTIPSTSTLVTMDVNSLYTNIDHKEGTDACYKKLKTRKNNTVQSNTLKSCILLILKSNIFRFCNTFHIQKRLQQLVLRWLTIMQTYLWTCLKYSEKKNMKSIIKFKISQYAKTINFLDVCITLKQQNYLLPSFQNPQTLTSTLTQNLVTLNI